MQRSNFSWQTFCILHIPYGSIARTVVLASVELVIESYELFFQYFLRILTAIYLLDSWAIAHLCLLGNRVMAHRCLFSNWFMAHQCLLSNKLIDLTYNLSNWFGPLFLLVVEMTLSFP